MNGSQFIFWAALIIGVAFFLVGLASKKVTPTAIGAGMVLACIASTVMPEGSMWMHP